MNQLRRNLATALIIALDKIAWHLSHEGAIADAIDRWGGVE